MESRSGGAGDEEPTDETMHISGEGFSALKLSTAKSLKILKKVFEKNKTQLKKMKIDYKTK